MFEDVTSDLGNIISEVNAKYGANFSKSNHQHSNVNTVFAGLDSLLGVKDSGATNEAGVARPSKQRKDLRSQLP